MLKYREMTEADNEAVATLVRNKDLLINSRSI